MDQSCFVGHEPRHRNPFIRPEAMLRIKFISISETVRISAEERMLILALKMGNETKAIKMAAMLFKKIIEARV